MDSVSYSTNLELAKKIAEDLDSKCINGKLYIKNGYVHRLVSDHELYNIIYKLCLKLAKEKLIQDKDINIGKIKEVASLISFMNYTSMDKLNPPNAFLVANGELLLNTKEAKIEFNQTPKHIYTLQGQVAYNPNIDLTHAKEYLNQIVPVEDEQELLIELLAFSMFPVITEFVSYDRFLIAFGAGSNGKSLFLDTFVTAIFGAGAIGRLGMDRLKSRFGISSLINKKLNVSTEADTNFISESAPLKALTSNDYQSIEQKYKDAFEQRLFCPSIFCINEQPHYSISLSYAMKRRIAQINFPNTFSFNPIEDQLLANPMIGNPKTEIYHQIASGLLKLIVTRAEEVMRTKELLPNNIEDIEDMQKESCHHLLMFDGFLTFDKSARTASKDLFHVYQIFCLKENILNPLYMQYSTEDPYDRPTPKANLLTRKLKRLFPDKLQTVKSGNYRGLQGVKIKSPFDYEKTRKEYFDYLSKVFSENDKANKETDTEKETVYWLQKKQLEDIFCEGGNEVNRADAREN